MIHDKQTSTSLASLSLYGGSMQDPVQAQGLTFLTLFAMIRKTQKYPQ